MAMAGFGGLRKGREEAKDNLSYTEGATVPGAVEPRKIPAWPVICNARRATMNGRTQTTRRLENDRVHQPTAETLK